MFRMSTLIQNAANPLLFGQNVEGFGYSNAVNAVLRHGVAGYWSNPTGIYRDGMTYREFVFWKSRFMADKLKTPDFTLHELQESGKESAIVKFSGQLLAETDNLTNIPMWVEAYETQIAKGASEYEAIRFSDTLIDRTTGSGRKIDTASLLQKRGAIGFFTMFQSFMNVQLNTFMRETRIAIDQKEYGRYAAYIGARMILFTVASAMLTGSGGDPEKDKDKYLQKWASEILSYPIRLFPVIGDMVKPAIDYAIGVKSFGYRMSPVQSQVENMQRLSSIFASDKKTPAEKAEAASVVAAFVWPYPDQFNDWFFNLWDIQNGMEAKPVDLLKRRPKKER